MYFNSIPTINYDLFGDGNKILFTDITRKVALDKLIKKDIVSFDFYDIQDGETPEVIAHLYYGDVLLHWVVLLTNNITNVYEQWPKSTVSLEEYVRNKYEDVDGTHHYEIPYSSGDTNKIIVLNSNENYPNATRITNFAHELSENNKKIRIRLIKPFYISQFVSEFTRLVSN